MKLTDPAELERLYAAMAPEQQAEIDALVAGDKALWRAQVGRQMEAINSTAYITGYGGAAGGGKSDLIAGLALTQHKRTLILRREKAQTDGIVQRMTEIIGSTNGYNSQKSVWRYDDRLIEFGGLDNPTDHQKWQGRAHDLKAYDEVTEMREAQVRFTMGWTRTNDPSQRARVLMTFNPPTTAEGRWVIDFFGPWLNDRHPNPAKAGELRWFTTLKGADVEVVSGDPFVMFRGEPLYDYDPSEFSPEKVVRPKSRTFIPSRVTDNYFYVKTGYIDTLQSLPEPLRSQMLNGDFNAGVEDDAWQVIPTVWIDAAMERWKPRDAKGEMDSIGADVAAGGKDNFVISRRHGTWFDELIRIPGRDLPQETAGQDGAGHVVMARRDRAVIHVDVVGWGLSTYNFLTANEVQTVAINGANGTMDRTQDGKLAFKNYRARLVWRMREALDPSNPDPIYLPPDPALRADLAAYKWKMTPGGIQVRLKEEMKNDLGRSPDDGDAVIMALEPTMKAEVFEALSSARNSYDRYGEL